MRFRPLHSVAMFVAVLFSSVAFVAKAQDLPSVEYPYPQLPKSAVMIPVGNTLTYDAQFTYAEVAEYLNAMPVDEMGGYADERIQELHNLVSGKEKVIIYLVDDIEYSAANVISVLPQGWTLDGRYHYINVVYNSPDAAGGSADDDPFLPDGGITDDSAGPLPELFKLTSVNSGDAQYNAGGLVVNYNKGVIKRLGFKASYIIDVNIQLTEDGAESVVFGTICGYNEGQVSEANVDISGNNRLSVNLTNSRAMESRLGGLVGVNAGVLSNAKSVINFQADTYVISTEAFDNPDQALGTAVGSLGASGSIKNVVAGFALSEEALGNMPLGFCGANNAEVADAISGMNISSHALDAEPVLFESVSINMPAKFGEQSYQDYLVGDTPDASVRGYYMANNAELQLCGFAERQESNYTRTRLAEDGVVKCILNSPELQLCLSDQYQSPSFNTIEFIDMALQAYAVSPTDNFLSDFSKTLKVWKDGTVDCDVRVISHDPENAGMLLLDRSTVFTVLPSDWIFDGKSRDGLGSIVVDAPLFNSVAKGAVLKNCNVRVAEQCAVDYHVYVNYGVLANVNEGEIFNCAVSGDGITLGPNYTDETGFVIGGLVGRNSGTISSCLYNSTMVATVKAGVNLTLGGIAGINGGTISDVLVHYYNTPDDRFIRIYGPGEENSNITGSVGYIVGGIEKGGQVTKAYHTVADPIYVPAVTAMEFPNLDVNLRPVAGSPIDGDSLYCFFDAEDVQFDTTQIYYNRTNAVLAFDNPSRWTMSAEYDSMSVIEYRYDIIPRPNYTELNADKVEIVEGKPILTVDDEADFETVAEVILNASQNASDPFNTAIVQINADLDLSAGKDDSYFDEWTSETDPSSVVTLPSFGTTQKPFKGTIEGNGHVISNVVGQFSDGSLFGNIGSKSELGTVNGLTLQGRIFVNINRYYNPFAGIPDTIYVPIFAEDMNGEASAMNFVGEVWYDDSAFDYLTDDEKPVVMICLVDKTRDESEVKNSFIYLFDEEQQSANKVCIVIKQNVGVGRGKGNKTASSKMKATDKAVGIFDPNTRTNDNEEFTAEEFASGEVANWLNFTGKGFTGEFTGMYSQSSTRPVLATNANGAVQRIDYSVAGLDGEMTDYISGPQFAKVGSDVEVQFSAKNPTAVTLDGQKLTLDANNKVSFVMQSATDGVARLSISYSATPTSVSDVDASQAIRVTAAQGSVSITGAAGQPVVVYNASGVAVANINAAATTETISLPQGFYVVSVGNEVYKVIVNN